MKDKLILFFVIGMIISCLFYSYIGLDYTLTPRFFFFSFFLLSFYIYSSFVTKNKRVDFDCISLSYLLFVVFSFSTMLWGICTTEVFFESSKVLLSFFVFCFTYKIVNRNEIVFYNYFLKGVLIAFFFSLLIFIFECLQLNNFSKEELYKIVGINGHKNLYSGFLFLCFIFSAIDVFKLEKKWKSIALISLFIQILLIIFLQTRAIWIGLLVTIFTFLVLRLVLFLRLRISKRNINLVFVSTLIVLNVFFVLVFPILLDAFVPKQSQLDSSQERLIVWKKTYPMIEKHLLCGVGVGNWQINFPNSTLSGLWRVEDLNVTFQRPHNDFLWILSETGLIGFNLYLVFVLGIFFFLLRFVIIDFSNDKLILGASIVGFLSFSFFDFPRERVEHMILFHVILALAYYHLKKNEQLKTFFSVKIDFRFFVPIILVLILVCFIGFCRIKGEYFTRKIYTERELKHPQKVVQYCDLALSYFYSIDPTSLPINWYKGNALATLGNYKGALDNFKFSYQISPYNRNVLNDLGSAFVIDNQSERAIFFYKEALRISPRFDDARLNLVAVFINLNNFEQAQFLNNICYRPISERSFMYKKIIDEYYQNNK